MDAPEAPPAECPVCDTGYSSVSLHESGLMVNLLDNARYRRVCFEPIERDGNALVRFYHHSHEQVGDTEASSRSETASGDATAPVEPTE